MSDMGVFLGQDVPYRQIFYNTGTGGTTWQLWEKPRGLTMVWMWGVGGGGGGGAGFTGTASSAGGGTGAPAMMTIPALLLPDRLYISVGKGGAGGASSGNAGAAGESSYISP